MNSAIVCRNEVLNVRRSIENPKRGHQFFLGKGKVVPPPGIHGYALAHSICLLIKDQSRVPVQRPNVRLRVPNLNIGLQIDSAFCSRCIGTPTSRSLLQYRLQCLQSTSMPRSLRADTICAISNLLVLSLYLM